MKRNSLLLPLLIFLSVEGTAKPVTGNNGKLNTIEDSLHQISAGVFKGNDASKTAANKKFTDLLRTALQTDGAFDYPFDSLKMIGRLRAPDNSFRVFNWDIPNDDGTYDYFGFIFTRDEKTKKTQLFELNDISDHIRNPQMSVLSAEKWYGALYYKIILTTDKHARKKYYTLLGWDGNNQLTWKKIIDVLTFSRDGKPVFGEKSLFNADKRSYRRIIFEFRADLVMALRYEENGNRIVFDHLAPEEENETGMYQFYSQTFSYDAYYWKKGKWHFETNIDARNAPDPNDKKYIKPVGDQNPGGKSSAPSSPGQQTHGHHGLFHRRKNAAPQPGQPH